jgi:hypothetical protein
VVESRSDNDPGVGICVVRADQRRRVGGRKGGTDVVGRCTCAR